MAIYTKKILSFSVRNYRNQLRKCAQNSGNADSIRAAKAAYLSQKNAQSNFNEINSMVTKISLRVREIVAQYPKGTFKRVHTQTKDIPSFMRE